MFEGRDIGSSSRQEDHANWRILRRGTSPDGRPWALGATRWRLFSAGVPLQSLSARAYSGAPALIAAITIRSDPEPPARGPVADFGDEGEWEE